MAFLSYDLDPGRSLGPFVLGSTIAEVFSYLLQHKKSYRRVDVCYEPQALLEKDIAIGLPEHGLRLAFDPVGQRLRLIEVVDADRLTVILRGRRLFGGAAMPPKLGEVYGVLGPTYPAEERENDDEESSFPLLYPGLLFLFPQQQQRDGSTRSSPLPEGAFCADAVARRVIVFAGVATSMPGALRAPAPLSSNDKSRQPRLKHACWFAVAGRGIYGLGGEQDAALELGCSVQSVLTVLGPPESCTPSRGLPAEQGRYALTYPHLGLDVLVDAWRHTVSRLILHGNLPGSPVFGLVERCTVRVLPSDAALWKDDSDREKEEVMGGSTSSGTNREEGDEENVAPAITQPPKVPPPIAAPPPEVALGKKKGKKARGRGASISTASSTAPSYAASSSSLSSGIPSLSSSPGLSTPSPLHDAPALRQAASRLGNGGLSTATTTALHEKRRGGSDGDADSVRGPSEGWSDADDLLPLVLQAQAPPTASIGVQTDEDGLTMMVGALELDDEDNLWDGAVSAFVVPEDIDLGAEAGFERVPLQRDCATQTQRRRLGSGGITHQPPGVRARPSVIVSSPVDMDVLARQRGVSMTDPIARVQEVFGPRRAARGVPLALSGPVRDAGATTLLYAYRGAVFETLPTGQLSTTTLFRP